MYTNILRQSPPPNILTKILRYLWINPLKLYLSFSPSHLLLLYFNPTFLEWQQNWKEPGKNKVFIVNYDYFTKPDPYLVVRIHLRKWIWSINEMESSSLKESISKLDYLILEILINSSWLKFESQCWFPSFLNNIKYFFIKQCFPIPSIIMVIFYLFIKKIYTGIQ